MLIRVRLLVLGCLLASCADSGLLELEILIPPGSNSLAGVTILRLTIEDSTEMVAATIFPDEEQFELSVDVDPDGNEHALVLEGLDDEGQVLCRGRTRPVAFSTDTHMLLPVVLRPTGTFSRSFEDLTDARSDLGAAAVQSEAQGLQLAIFGGLGVGGDKSATLELFDPYRSVFDQSIELDLGRSDPQLLAQDGRLWVLGDGSSVVIVNLEDLSLEVVTSPVPIGIGAGAAFAQQDLVLVVGGELEGESQSALLLVDRTGVVAPNIQLTAPRSHHLLLAAEGRPLYLAVGGLSSPSLGAAVDVIDLERNTVEPVEAEGDVHAALSTRHQAAARVGADTWAVCGGENPEDASLLPFCHQIELVCADQDCTVELRPRARLLTARSRHSMTSTGDGLLVAGGKTDTGASSSVEICSNAVCDPGPALLHARFGHAAVELPGGEVVMVGGEHGEAPVPAIEFYVPRQLP